MSDSQSPSPGYDAYAHRAFYLMHKRVEKGGEGIPATPMPIPRVQRSFRASRATSTDDSKPIGILGAGPGGLYTALILDDLGLPYEILEAQDHVGGRLFTYEFPDQTGAPYNYFDVGAMRFPKIPAMNRVFKLFDYDPLDKPNDRLRDRLQPFLFAGTNKEKTMNTTRLSYNDITIRVCDIVPGVDEFKSAETIEDAAAAQYIKVGAAAIADDVIAPFAEAILEDLKTPGKYDGLEKLMELDDHSTRSYMALVYQPSPSLGLPNTGVPGLPTDVVNWCETFNGGTGWYDRAFSETVLEAIAFGWQPGPNPPPTPWFCLNGGAQQLAKYMADYITKQQPNAINFNQRVTAIGLSDDGTYMNVVANGSTPYQFSRVICTIPLPVLRTVDLQNAGLSPMQSNALRELNYGPSIKIGVQFQTAWWTNSLDAQGNPLDIVGGQTYTDSPLRTIVYPSFGDVFDGKTTTLIASYCWTEDAERLGALIANDQPTGTLKDLVFRELASIHGVTEDFLNSQYLDMKAWSWSQDPYTMGAFAFFGPGKFNNLYKSLNSPAASGLLHFAGEALSVRHAWVEGALDSAWKAVYGLLSLGNYPPEILNKFVANWGSNPEWIGSSLAKPKSAPHRGGGPMRTPRTEEPQENIFDPQNNLLLRHIALSSPGLFE